MKLTEEMREHLLYTIWLNKMIPSSELKSVLTSSTVNARNFHGQTPLMLSIINKNNELSKHILSTDSVDIHVKSFSDGKNAVMLACEYGNDEILSILLQKEADLLDVDTNGRNSLYYVIKSKHFGNLRRVLGDKKVKMFINQQDYQGKTGMHHALGHHFYPEMKSLIIELLAKDADVNIVDAKNKKPHEYYSTKDLELLFGETDYNRKIKE